MNRWWKTVVAYPATWVVVALILIAENRLFSRFQPGSIGTLVLIGLGVLMLAAWPVIMSATGTIDRIRSEAEELTETRAGDLPRLKKQLAAIKDQRPRHQLAMIQSKGDNLTQVLSQRLDAGEMTYARYLTAGRQVEAAGLENLREVALAYKSISTISPVKIQRRLAELAGTTGSANDRERDSLEARLDLHGAQTARIADLLAQNESLMTAIDRTSTSLSEAPIGRTPAGAEDAMQELEEMARRARKYAGA